MSRDKLRQLICQRDMAYKYECYDCPEFKKKRCDALIHSILNWFKEEIDGVKKAIEILGRPTMHYAPKIAIKEYDEKIANAVKILLDILTKIEE